MRSYIINRCNRLFAMMLIPLLLCGLTGNATAGLFGSSPKVKVVYTMPPEVKLGDISRIAILPIKYDERERLYNKMSSKLHEAGQGITLIERGELASIFAEQNLAASDLVDIDSVPDLGAIQGVDALITGTATVFSVEDQHYKQEVKWTETTKVDGKKKTIDKSADASAQKRKGQLNLTIKLLHVSTGAIIGQKEFTASVEHIYVKHKEAKKQHRKLVPDKNTVKEQLLDNIMLSIARYLFPYQVTYEVKLDEKCGADECKEAIDLMKMDMHEMAEENLTEFLEVVKKRTKKRKEKKNKDQGLAAILYNLGVAKEAQGKMDEALSLYKEAIVVTIKKKNKNHSKGMKRVQAYLDSWEAYNAGTVN